MLTQSTKCEYPDPDALQAMAHGGRISPSKTQDSRPQTLTEDSRCTNQKSLGFVQARSKYYLQTCQSLGMGLQPISREHSDHILDFEDWKGAERDSKLSFNLRICCVESILKSLVVVLIHLIFETTSSQLYTVLRSKGYHQ